MTAWIFFYLTSNTFVGDGAGVGKGRTIAGIIYENYLKGRKKALWISVSNDLKYDAERDLQDIGASKIEVHRLNKVRIGQLTIRSNPESLSNPQFFSVQIRENLVSNKRKCKERRRLQHVFSTDRRIKQFRWQIQITTETIVAMVRRRL